MSSDPLTWKRAVSAYDSRMGRQGDGDEMHAASDVQDNRAANRFELTVDGLTAFLAYERNPDTLVLIHTEVPDRLRGHHLGDQLVMAALDAARREGRRPVAVCPFVRAYFRRHPDQR